MLEQLIFLYDTTFLATVGAREHSGDSINLHVIYIICQHLV